MGPLEAVTKYSMENTYSINVPCVVLTVQKAPNLLADKVSVMLNASIPTSFVEGGSI